MAKKSTPPLTVGETPPTSEQLEAMKAEVRRLFDAMAPDEAAYVDAWLEQATRIMGVFQRRAAVRSVEGRGLSARDQAAMQQLNAAITKVLEATDPDAETRRRLQALEHVTGVDGAA